MTPSQRRSLLRALNSGDLSRILKAVRKTGAAVSIAANCEHWFASIWTPRTVVGQCLGRNHTERRPTPLTAVSMALRAWLAADLKSNGGNLSGAVTSPGQTVRRAPRRASGATTARQNVIGARGAVRSAAGSRGRAARSA